MNIQIKHMKIFIGREGYGFNASLYVDGKKVAFIMDDANGGPFHYDVFDKVVFAELESYVKTLPPIVSEWGELEMDMDLFINEAVQKVEEEKKLKNLCRTKTVFSYDNGLTKYTAKVKFSPFVKESLETKYGKDVIIYNERF